MINATIMGKFTSKPVLAIRQIKDGTGHVVDTPVLNFTVACKDGFRTDSNGNTKNEEFVRVAAFRGAAETIAKYADKGRNIAVTGALHLKSYQKDGNVRYYLGMNALTFEFGTDSKEYVKKMVLNDMPEGAIPEDVEDLAELDASLTPPATPEAPAAVASDEEPW